MALKGTLRDFGIADILQLISHQRKSGVLIVKTRGQQVVAYFVDGDIIRAEDAGRKQRDMLGNMLLRANLIAPEELEASLEQRSSGRLLGDVLVETTSLTEEDLQHFAELQTSETLYRLFLWRDGSYAFTQQDDVAISGREVRVSGEHVLMEGFRQVDEWPVIRKKINSYGMVFDRLGDLDALGGPGSGATDYEFETAVFQSRSLDKHQSPHIGHAERIVYDLVAPDRETQSIIDLSRLGEFETCKALVTLMELGLIGPALAGAIEPTAEATVGGITVRKRVAWMGIAGASLLAVALSTGVIFESGASELDIERLLGTWHAVDGFRDDRLRQKVSHNQMQKIREALEIYHAERERYPANLEDLVNTDLLGRRELNFPWAEAYYYRRVDDSYQLLRPLY